MTITIEQEASAQKIPSIARWVENYCFDAYDAKNNVGYFIHLGRWTANPAVWCEKLYIAMPDGSVAMQHNYGMRPSSTGAKGAILEIEILEPGKTLRLSYDGPARPTTSAELLAGHLTDLSREPLHLDVTFTGTGEIWDFSGRPTDHGEEAFHIEQPGRIAGTVSFAGKTSRMDGVGYRDHSRGARSLGTMADSSWVHGHFKDRSFALYGVREFRNGVVVPKNERAVIWDKGVQYEAVCAVQPYLKSSNPFDGYGGSYSLLLRSDLGEMRIDARILRSLPYTYEGGTNEFLIGSGGGEYEVYEEITEFVWNGETGHGNTERSLRRLPFPAAK